MCPLYAGIFPLSRKIAAMQHRGQAVAVPGNIHQINDIVLMFLLVNSGEIIYITAMKHKGFAKDAPSVPSPP
jgi:hypothetical protein